MQTRAAEDRRARPTLGVWLALALSLALVACGGGSGGETGTSPDSGADVSGPADSAGADATTDVAAPGDSAGSPDSVDSADSPDSAGGDVGGVGGDVGDDDTGGCTPGALGCACLTGDTCLDAADECVGGVCAPRTTCDGELGCACRADGGCDAGLDCVGDVCRTATGLLVRVTGGDPRACDVLVTTTGRMTADVIFPAGARGRMRTRNEKTAIAVLRTTDTALAGVVATVVLDGDEAAAATLVESVSATCYDRLGQPDGAAAVTVE